jgi:hypothetical protein
LDAIVPFFPLDRATIKDILAHNIPFQMTLEVTDSLLDRIEFQTWMHKATDAEIFTFSPTGAKPAMELANKLITKVYNSCSPMEGDIVQSGLLRAEDGMFLIDTCGPSLAGEKSVDCTELCRFHF